MIWKLFLIAFFIFSDLEGFVVSYLYPAKLPLLYKDFLLLFVYLLFMNQEGSKHWVSRFHKILGNSSWNLFRFFTAFCIIQLFNPSLYRFEVGLLGLKGMLFYVPLSVIMFAYCDSVAAVKKFLWILAIIAVPLSIFGMVQFWQPPDFMVNRFGPGFARSMVITSGNTRKTFLRVFSTFASGGQFSVFLSVMIMFLVGLFFTESHKIRKMVLIAIIFLLGMTLLATGTRGALLVLIVMLMVFMIMCRWLFKSILLIIIIGVVFQFGFRFLGNTVRSRFETLQDADMIRSRSTETTYWMFMNQLEANPFGRGPGTASVASRYVMDSTLGERVEFIENNLAKLQYELGIVGVGLFYWFWFSVLFRMKNMVREASTSAYVLVATMMAAFAGFTLSAIFGAIDTAPGAIYIWVVIGIAAGCLRETVENEKNIVSP